MLDLVWFIQHHRPAGRCSAAYLRNLNCRAPTGYRLSSASARVGERENLPTCRRACARLWAGSRTIRRDPCAERTPCLDTIETTRKQKIKILHLIKVKRGYCMYCSYCGCDCIVIHQIEGACIDCDLKSPETFKSSTSSRLEDDNDSSSLIL